MEDKKPTPDERGSAALDEDLLRRRSEQMRREIATQVEMQQRIEKLELARRMWQGHLTEREQLEVGFARIYAKDYCHGTDGHNRLLLIAKLADLLDQHQ